MPGNTADLDDIEDEVFDQVVAAQSIGSIAARYGIARASFYNWLRDGGERRQQAFKDAQRQSADAHAEMAVEILDEAIGLETSAQATIARARSDSHKWLAERFGRETYGEQKAELNVTMNVGQLHLDSLRVRGSMGTPTLLAQPHTTHESAVIDNEASDDGEAA